jgi:hypothetical protein
MTVRGGLIFKNSFTKKKVRQLIPIKIDRMLTGLNLKVVRAEFSTLSLAVFVMNVLHDIQKHRHI